MPKIIRKNKEYTFEAEVVDGIYPYRFCTVDENGGKHPVFNHYFSLLDANTGVIVESPSFADLAVGSKVVGIKLPFQTGHICRKSDSKIWDIIPLLTDTRVYQIQACNPYWGEFYTVTIDDYSYMAQRAYTFDNMRKVTAWLRSFTSKDKGIIKYYPDQFDDITFWSRTPAQTVIASIPSITLPTTQTNQKVVNVVKNGSTHLFCGTSELRSETDTEHVIYNTSSTTWVFKPLGSYTEGMQLYVGSDINLLGMGCQLEFHPATYTAGKIVGSKGDPILLRPLYLNHFFATTEDVI